MTSGRAAEARILRRTRWKLVAWSAGSTFLVLLAMGGVLYAATARWLQEDVERQLRERAAMLTFGTASVEVSGGGVTISSDPLDPSTSPQVIQLEPPVPVSVGPIAAGSVLSGTVPAPGGFVVGPSVTQLQVSTDPAQVGLLMGGSLSGTIAMALPEDRTAWAPAMPAPLDVQGYAVAAGGDAVVNQLDVLGAPMVVLSQPVVSAEAGGPFVVQVGMDRSAQLRTLESLAIVLVVAGAAAVAVAAAFGWLFAGRALVPVRESLRRQRELAADASHELRTPLAVIRGNVELLRAGVPAMAGPAGEPGPLEEIDAEVGRLTGLVDQLLLLARADSDALELDPAPTDLAGQAADAVESLEPVAAARGVDLVLDLEPAPLVADPGRLRQLAAILVDNAIRHASVGGHAWVTAGPAEGGWVRLVVRDDGPGIRPDDLAHVFDRFWRAADAPTGGSGLGLAIAHWIAEAHDGTIVAGNDPDGGARFEVRLPVR